MTDDREAIIEKIQKLLALSTSSNVFEAELAAAKANDLMQKYQIEMSETVSVIDTIIHEDYLEIKRAKWCAILANGCAELFDSTTLINPRNATELYFVGTKTNIAAAKMMFTYLMASWHRIAENDFAAAQDRGITTHGKAFKASHGFGYAVAIRKRCYVLATARKRSVKAHSESGRALIVVSDQALNDHMKNYKSCKPIINTTKLTSLEGMEAGRIAGNSVYLMI